ncbi:glycoside hydrolase family 5 protein [Amycolatopsis pigmentata]|uniref:Glycoside hydrolase family 5 protein n=1 Tax=Amycolatopsis pigmentata TaxID=450801 RepID=A0ABW5FTX2_9PSEU
MNRRLLAVALSVVSVLGFCAGTAPAQAAPATHPLHTSGRWILDAGNHRVKLAGVNWDGAESPEYVVAGLDKARLGDIAHWIKVNGFNSVRLPWSNEMYEHNPVVQDAYLTANPDLKGKRALDVFDAVVDALGAEGLMVILDNHVSRADWCCSGSDGNALWYTDQYPESNWINDWKGIVSRYRNRPQVVGVELRNEVRSNGTLTPVWGGGDPATDWAAAAERAGNAVLSVDQDLLVIVGGVNYQSDLTGVGGRPIRLSVGGRTVYAAHSYRWFVDVKDGYSAMKDQLGRQWGYLIAQGKPYTAPVWVSEFGTCLTWVSQCTQDDANFSNGIQRYLSEGDFDWAYWQLNGTQSDSLDHGSGKPRQHGALDWYGLLNTAWNGPSDAANVDRIKALEPVTQHP